MVLYFHAIYEGIRKHSALNDILWYLGLIFGISSPHILDLCLCIDMWHALKKVIQQVPFVKKEKQIYGMRSGEPTRT